MKDYYNDFTSLYPQTMTHLILNTYYGKNLKKNMMHSREFTLYLKMMHRRLSKL